MNKRRKPTGLPYRLYERYGVRLYSIGYKQTNGKWAFRYTCPIEEKSTILAHRSKAISQTGLLLNNVTHTGGTQELIDAWFKWQNSLPLTNMSRRAESTLKENKRESLNLISVFGHMDPNHIKKSDAYKYLDC